MLAALIPLILFAVLVQRRVRSPWILVPIAMVTWALVHESGVHATVAGVLLGFMVPVLHSERDSRRTGADDGPGLAEYFEHIIRPVSAGLAVPIFAFFAAGVTFGGYDGLVTSLRDPIALGIVAGLVVGKTVGIFGTTRLIAKVTRAEPGLLTGLDRCLRGVDAGRNRVHGIPAHRGIGLRR